MAEAPEQKITSTFLARGAKCGGRAANGAAGRIDRDACGCSFAARALAGQE